MTSDGHGVRVGHEILVAGIGNVFLGDDGFGVEVVQRLVRRALPPEVHVVDFGIRGFDLAYALAGGYRAAVLVDALQRGQAPGTLFVLEPEIADAGEAGLAVETHGMDPVKVLQLARFLGGSVTSLRLVGCEPLTFGDDDDVSPGLSGPVLSAVEGAIDLVLEQVAELKARL